MLQDAYVEMRAGKGTEAVRILAATFLRLLELQPEMLGERIQLRPGIEMPLVMRWPALGANLVPASLREGKPEITFVRERFAVSEAMTYYEYTLETVLKRGL